MNTKFFTSALIAVASLASVNAFAAGADNAPEQKSNFVSSLTRAEVRAEAAKVQKGPVTASNQVDGGTMLVATPAAGERTRTDVRAEAVQTHQRFDSAPGRA
ncbi:DUF4148 domain-containing protein [Polaromonas eurypsychrophila]|uniref:DUF4148 domain-containing protein n=1 Tax=Polaromonas eurypsychrophila TaxID=1614635 RepID=A0A916S708_9BURK|nr:DUF4148 domain-containing protein [Polaromonas eurypsychrophila]GGA84656.1 hypothetical protein GCM10011496_01460 [Polaromonas eurypsychrophila]